MNIQDLGLAEPVLRAVLMEGYTQATPIQSKAISPILGGCDVIGCAQTGTGKTAAFALPILHRLIEAGPPRKGMGRKIRALILASTRELASQIRDSFATYGQYTPLRVAAIYGGVSQGPQERALRNGIDILVATPGRLLDLMSQGYVDLRNVETLVLDEADRMLDMGFLPPIREIIRSLPAQRQTLLFSATMPAPITQLANSILNDPLRITIEPERKTTELVDQSVCFVPQKQKVSMLIDLLEEHKPERCIVFSRTKHGADRIVKSLVAAGFKSDAIHSNKSQNARQRILDSFKWDNPPILVATDIAARGIDVDGITHVFNFDMPNDAETYVHRIGRTGRAGANGRAISLCDVEEKKILRSVESLLGRKVPIDRTAAGMDMTESSSGKSSGRNSGRNGKSDRSGQSGRSNTGRSNTGRSSNGGRTANSSRVGKAEPTGDRAPDGTSKPRKAFGKKFVGGSKGTYAKSSKRSPANKKRSKPIAKKQSV